MESDDDYLPGPKHEVCMDSIQPEFDMENEENILIYPSIGDAYVTGVEFDADPLADVVSVRLRTTRISEDRRECFVFVFSEIERLKSSDLIRVNIASDLERVSVVMGDGG